MDGLRKRLLILFTLQLICGCSSTHAPSGWLPSRAETKHDVFGSWMDVALSGPGGNVVSGELLAIQDDSLFLLNYFGLGVIGLNDIHKAHVTQYKSEAGYAVGAFFLGMPVLITHGHSAGFSAPGWIILSGLAAIISANENKYSYPKNESGDLAWKGIKQFAHFPQGLPVTVPRAELQTSPHKTQPGSMPTAYAVLYATFLVHFLIGAAIASSY